MEYLVGDKKFSFSYQELKKEYLKVCGYDQWEFYSNRNEILHLACFICFIKDIPTYLCMADDGIVHELAHLITNIETVNSLEEIQELFKNQLKLD